MTQDIIIFGNGEIAEVCHHYFTEDSPYRIKAFTVDRDYISAPTFLGLPVVPFEEVEKTYPPSTYKAFVAIGFSKRNTLRSAKYFATKQKGYSLVSYISSRASVWKGLQVGDNTFIFEDNTIQPFTHIGSDIVLWSGNHIGHHARIEDHCFLTSHVVVSGGTQIGDHTFIGVNATLKDHIRIGKSNVIGAGALILENTEDHAVYPGVGTKKRERVTE